MFKQLKCKQEIYYNQHIKSLTPLRVGHNLYATHRKKHRDCINKNGSRSYKVKMGEQEIHETLHQPRLTKEL